MSLGALALPLTLLLNLVVCVRTCLLSSHRKILAS